MPTSYCLATLHENLHWLWVACLYAQAQVHSVSVYQLLWIHRAAVAPDQLPSASLRSVLLFRLLKESSRTFLFQQQKSVQLLFFFFVFFNVIRFVLTWHVTSPQVLPQARPPPPGESSPYSPSDRSAWFVKDYWKSARTKSERSTMRYWQQSWQVCLFFTIVAQHNSSQVRHNTGH